MKTPFEILNKYLEWANDLVVYASAEIKVDSGSINKFEFSCQAKSYKNVHDFARRFKVKFKKEQSASASCLNYEYQDKNLTILLYAIGELSPSCKVKYEKVKIPAQKAKTETRAIVICK